MDLFSVYRLFIIMVLIGQKFLAVYMWLLISLSFFSFLLVLQEIHQFFFQPRKFLISESIFYSVKILAKVSYQRIPFQILNLQNQPKVSYWWFLNSEGTLYILPEYSKLVNRIQRLSPRRIVNQYNQVANLNTFMHTCDHWVILKMQIDLKKYFRKRMLINTAYILIVFCLSQGCNENKNLSQINLFYNLLENNLKYIIVFGDVLLAERVSE
eukprot:TRINITY_DN9257_c0_g1_i4.p1 TRINITY_DN9257_c0_g1~~TRINITY_DN9257_c0_g1_i4.p1  ORF type:complete len:212 (-),score=-12.07 TRINITY_DN9257_c0_g1_i4:27-662(-)